MLKVYYTCWRVWLWPLSLTNFKLAWKMVTLVALFAAKHCCDLTLLCIDDHLFLHDNATIFILASGGKTD